MLKNNDYSRTLILRCVVCGDTESFSHNEDETYIICKRCGREYFGGKSELVDLNEQFIESEVEDIKAEVAKEIQAEINKNLNSIFK
ncbi:MAG: hypothetical protein IJ756_06985 [Paludibacteraceae bacterium]|nr:hypothetical protein [Paludibacteraceae bacterium]